MDRSIIDNYEAGGEKLALAVRGLLPADLQWKPPADAGIGLWSIQQIVIHVMDADLIAIDRMKRIIAEENPTLIGFDESLFARNLFYEEQSVADAVTIIELSRRMFAGVLRRVPDEAFARIGQHNERGQVTLLGLLTTYTQHLEHHLSFVHKKRAAMGKEMW